jgi:hypothetical protein
MALYMDTHRNVGDIKKEKIDEAHAVQGKYGVEITDYWHSEKDGAIFCLAEAPTKEAFGAVHREAHINVTRNSGLKPIVVPSGLLG